jgi:hypothetical protein
MSSPRTIAFAAAAAVAVTATLGCGFISAASNLAGNISTLSDFADKITKSETATFQATYKLQDGTSVTVAQKPPNAATVSAKGAFIVTADSFYMCDKSSGSWVCQKSPNNSGGTADPAAVAAMGGNGFISAPLAVAVLTAAIVVPNAHVDKSTTTIAGQSSTCAKVSNLAQAQQGNETSKVSDFTVCITDSGVLARFEGTTTDGTKANVELTTYSGSVDGSLLQPPAGAQINDVNQLGSPSPAST